MSRFRHWAVARLLFSTHLPFLVLLWVPVAVLLTAAAGVVAVVGTVNHSVWDIAVPILRWFALGYGAYLTTRMLPLCIAHGRTRREFMIQSSCFVAALTGVLGALLALGYLLEKGVYGLAGWRQQLADERLFDAPDQFWLIALCYWVLLLLWTTVGAFLGAGFTGADEGWGVIALLPAVVLAILASVATGINGLPFVSRLLGESSLGLPIGMLSCLAGYAVGLAITWGLVREIPVRTRTS
ncbi:MAG: hypothetical protein GXX79_10330 [Actinomycetales bacterium]|nr:hypothetical protein [Actinomycetales bacterium]